MNRSSDINAEAFLLSLALFIRNLIRGSIKDDNANAMIKGAIYKIDLKNNKTPNIVPPITSSNLKNNFNPLFILSPKKLYLFLLYYYDNIL